MWRIVAAVVMWSMMTKLSYAAVLINEVAWMGTEESYLCEWIELYNNGNESVSLADWYLQIGDGPLRAFSDGEASSLTIAAGQYYVVERLVPSCPDPVPSQTDMQLAFGNIPNSETSITLLRSQTSTDIEDKVVSGEDWLSLGGDNTSKETAQYSSAGWFTAPATPGERNLETSQEETRAVESRTTDSQSGQTIIRDTETSAAELSSEPNLVLHIDTPATVYQKHPANFTFVPSGLPDTLLESLAYQVNFGDMHDTVVGHKEVTHSYEFAGEYALVVTATFKDYQATAQAKVKVLPIPLELTKTAKGDIQIHNSAPYEVDISGYTIQAKQLFSLPEQTVLLPKATVSIAAKRLGGVDDYVYVRDRENVIVSKLAEAAPEQTAITASPAPLVAGVTTSTNPKSKESVLPAMKPATTTVPIWSNASNTHTDNNNNYQAHILLAGLLLLSVLTIFMTSKKPEPPKSELEL